MFLILNNNVSLLGRNERFLTFVNNEFFIS